MDKIFFMNEAINEAKKAYDSLEIKQIIDLGGRVKDVIVEHPTYGVLKAELNVSTNRDLKKFMEKATTNEFNQLSSVIHHKVLHLNYDFCILF